MRTKLALLPIRNAVLVAIAAVVFVSIFLTFRFFGEIDNVQVGNNVLLVSRAKYSGMHIRHHQRRDDLVYIDASHIRRVRRDVDEPTPVLGIARECGHSCHLRLHSHDNIYHVHMRRWNQLSNDSSTHYSPLVMYLDSNETISARMANVHPECIYRAHVRHVKEHSIVNLCDSDNGLFGLLALPNGVHTVEPIVDSETDEPRHRRHLVQKFDPHHFKAFDDTTEEQSTPIADYRQLWEDVAERKPRSRRAANSWDHYVEVLVVADSKMYEYHGHNLEDYILTLFSTVASIYRHQSLRASINVVVVKIIVLKTENSGPRITQNAQQTLQDFCRWQQFYNDPDDAALQHHDVAILLTRKDICRSPGKCDTLGLAELGTMCDGQKSCAIIEDNGLSAAFTIAHELGHVFAIPHDDERRCGQFMQLAKQNYHIMAPTLEYNTHPWSWSPCSSSMLERFLENHRGQIQCLFDKPVERRYYETALTLDEPGKKYDATQQCKFVFGPASELCPYMPTCRRLWCATFYGNQLGCRTQHMPWADGTPCDESKSMFCHHGECLRIAPDSLAKVDGQWGSWRGWGECSRTCGGGIQKALRDCDNPRPMNGGKYCVGQRERYRSCNTQECPWDTPPFREIQCSEFNNKDIGIDGVSSSNTKWVPKYSNVAVNERCKLYCQLSGSAAFYLLRDKVADGTPCDRNGDDICVAGTCMPAGCDHQLYSTMRRDKCGICGGDDTTCHVVKGTFNERGTFGYNEVMKIPAGSANIDIQQRGRNNDDDNYLSLRAANGEFLLNGHFQVSQTRQHISVQDAILEYSGSDALVERINGTGPIRVDIFVHVLTVGSQPPDIYYEYMTSSTSSPANLRHHLAPSAQQYSWRRHWSECDRMCGGKQTQRSTCYSLIDNRAVRDQYCTSRKPKDAYRACNTACTLKWSTSDATECSSKCGHGQKRQHVMCVKESTDKVITVVESRHCAGLAKPASTVPCYNDCTGRRWKYSDWGGCSATCGDRGLQTRAAYCLDANGERIDNAHLCGTREPLERECNRVKCPRWSYGHWSECSRSCDGGVRLRHAQCLDSFDREVHSSICATSPETHEACNTHPCTFWQFGAWSECSATCGDGVQTRDAQCTNGNRDRLADKHCNRLEKIVSKACRRKPCPQWKLGEWSQCSVSCGDGWSSRRIVCMDGDEKEVDSHYCGGINARPAIHKPCSHGTCPYWKTNEWSACSSTCGVGHRTRTIECIYREQSVDASYCGESHQPATVQSCTLFACASWTSSAWSACSVTCGSGLQKREIHCTREGKRVDEAYCNKSERPRNQRVCERHECRKPLIPLKHVPQVPKIRWVIGPWSACSTTCGNGTQRRLIKCRDGERQLPEKYCAGIVKEPEERSCNLRVCASWRSGHWQPCPSTCGMHVQQMRNVSCISMEGVVVNDIDCDVQKRPVSTRLCPIEPCAEIDDERIGSWITGNWSKCSTLCGGGWRRRTVTCTSTSCDERKKPRMFDRCNEDRPCTHSTNSSWQISPWTHCSVTCGGGSQRRRVWCEDITTGKMQNDTVCFVDQKPIERRDCEMPPCPTSAPSRLLSHIKSSVKKIWQTSPWSACSAECGRGTKQRLVECVDPSLNVTVASTRCNPSERPVDRIRCRVSYCPRWKGTTWSSCSVTCGRGIRNREVHCYRGRKTRVDDSECNAKTKLNTQAYCFPVACPAFKWTTTPWSKCKDECSRGQKQTRRVYCISNTGKRAAPRMCDQSMTPPVERECDISRCPYEWVPGDWQTCSKTCGTGIQTRQVSCRLRRNKTITPIDEPAVPGEKCKLFPKPIETQPCVMDSCDLEYRWQFGPWGTCSKTCGQGIRRRKVRCTDRNNRRVHRNKCSSKRPRRTQSCFERNCLPSTCQEIRSTTGTAQDGNYTVLLDGYKILIYCHQMNATIPKAYLNVDSNTNYAEVYGKKLIYPHTCPFNGERNESCHCSDDGDANAGMTRFRKIRVDLLNRKIHLTDFTFADKIYGNHVPYATAGDCYSMKECPQGRFGIDLRSAGVRIVDDLNWEPHGHRTTSRIDRMFNNAMMEGRCGGYCGKCAPERYKGLIFEVNTKVLSKNY